MASTPAGAAKDEEKLPSKQCLVELFETGYLSDITLKIGHEEIKVHKSILAAKSNWFKRKIADDAALSTLTLTKPTIMHSFALLKSAIRFLYSSEYPEKGPFKSEDGSPSDESIDVCLTGASFAENYGMSSLYDHCTKDFTALAAFYFGKRSEDSVFSLLSGLYRSQRLTVSLTKLVKSVVLEEFKRRIEKLQEEGKFDQVSKRSRNNPWITADLLSELIIAKGQLKASKEWKCASCDTIFTYAGKTERVGMQLLVCPCCPKTRKRTLDEEPLRDPKKSKGGS